MMFTRIPLDRRREPGMARGSDRQPADRAHPAARQLPSRVQHARGEQDVYTQVRIDPLPPKSADELLTALLGQDGTLEPLKRLLIERIEGHPFLLEESPA